MKSCSAGADEVGRGAWAGPVVVAIVRLASAENCFADSKKLPASKREELGQRVRDCHEWCIASSSADEIDALGINPATFLAFDRCLQEFERKYGKAEHVLLDGLYKYKFACPTTCVPGGDAIHQQISAASIVAKVWRDEFMRKLSNDFPGYAWDRNAGYGTCDHRKAITTLGLTSHHRRTFKPCAGLDVYS